MGRVGILLCMAVLTVLATATE
jgi:hypothetical protein